MIESITKNILEFLKLAPRYLATLGLVSAFFLFSPESILKKLSIFEFVDKYRPWFGIVLILASALLLVSVTIWIKKIVQYWWRTRRFYNSMSEKLNHLTEDEKQILRFYIAKQSKTNVLRIDDGTVQGLVSAGIIYRAASLGNMLEGFAYNISDFAWNYLNIHTHLLVGNTNVYRTDKRNWLY